MSPTTQTKPEDKVAHYRASAVATGEPDDDSRALWAAKLRDMTAEESFSVPPLDAAELRTFLAARPGGRET